MAGILKTPVTLTGAINAVVGAALGQLVLSPGFKKAGASLAFTNSAATSVTVQFTFTDGVSVNPYTFQDVIAAGVTTRYEMLMGEGIAGQLVIGPVGSVAMLLTPTIFTIPRDVAPASDNNGATSDNDTRQIQFKCSATPAAGAAVNATVQCNPFQW